MARLTPLRDWIGTPSGVALCASVLSLALVTLTVAFPGTPRREHLRRQSALERDASRAAFYAREAHEAVRRVTLRDSLLALTVRGVEFRFDPTMDRAMRDSLELRLRQAWGGFGLKVSEVPVLIVGWRQRPEHLASEQVDAFSVLPIAAGQPCLVLLTSANVGRGHLAENVRSIRLSMTGCALLARYGLPAAAVRQELRRVGWRPLPLTLDRAAGNAADMNTLLLARYTLPATWVHLTCIAGRDSSCEAAATDPMAAAVLRGRELPPQLSIRSFGWGFRGRDRSAALLSFLSAVLPPRTFAALWADDRSFSAAVQAHTGRSLGAWYRDLLLRHQAPLVGVFSTNGPLLVRAGLFLMLAAAFSVAAHRRRVVTSQ